MKNRFFQALTICGFILSGCASRGVGHGKLKSAAVNVTESEASKPTKLEPNQWPLALENGALLGNVLCENAPKVVTKAGKADLTEVFGLICVDNSPSNLLGDLFSKAYTGAGTPQVSVLVYDESDIFVTKFLYGYAVRVKLGSPALFTEIPLYEELSKGLKTEDSLLSVKKVAEEFFAGKGSFRTLRVEYDMPYAEGAGIFDKRTTESTTYLLAETSQDINITVEHLLNPEQNEYYLRSNGLVIGVKGSPGETYLVYINDFVVVNRFDTKRLKRAVLKLTEKLQESVRAVAER